jgi:hypothetical protein
MTIFSESSSKVDRCSLPSVRYFAMEHLAVIHATTLDLRWAMLELAWRSLTASCLLAQAQLTLFACRFRHGKRCLARRLDAADTMVAAGGR